MTHPLFPGPTPPSKMRVTDPSLYYVTPTGIVSERGQVVSEIRTEGGRLVGIITLPVDLLADVEEAAA